MTKITYPIESALPDGNLHSFDYELRMNSSLKISKSGTDVIIIGDVDFILSELAQILAEGGDVEDYLMVIKAPIAGLTASVPDTMPDSTKKTDSGTELRQYNDWIAPENIWTNTTHFYFLTQTVAGTKLKASEISILNDLTGVSVLLVSDQEFIDIQNA